MPAEQRRCDNCISWLRLKANAVIGQCQSDGNGGRFTNQRATCARHSPWSSPLIKAVPRRLSELKKLIAPLWFLGLHLGDFA